MTCYSEIINRVCSGPWYDATNSESIEKFSSVLETKIQGTYKIIEFKAREWRIGHGTCKDLVVVKPGSQDLVDSIHDEISKITVDVVHTDCHGMRREE
jgi:hypothetical protein